jgi:4-amino-4-deoxy-L-arabinose transferase-like glycosyltransferase
MGVSRSMIAMLKGRFGLLAMLICFLLLVAWGWVGYLGSDDTTYAIGAYGWIEEFPYVGGHGTIRYPITMPMALSFLTFGGNEFAMVLPSLLYMIGFLIMIWATVRGIGNDAMAVGALAMLITSPLLVIQSGIASIDIVEMTFLFVSVLLFWRCLEHGPDAKKLFAAGAFAGLAFLSRETAIFIAIFYAVFFMIGYRFHRGHYLWITAGFLFIWALEILYLWTMTGDPLYRINIALNHDDTINRSIDVAGNLIVHPLIDPLLVLFANQEFMALFFVAIPSGLWLCFSKSVEPRVKHFARIFGTLALVWFLAAGAVQKLLPLNPRYFMIPATVGCIVTGIALALLWERAKWRVAVLTLFIISTNMLGIYVENKDSMFAERTLAATAITSESPLYTDPMTHYRADMMLKWEGELDQTYLTPPPPGSLYFYNPKWADKANAKMTADQMAAYQPQSGWRKIWSKEPEPPAVTRLIEASGLASLMPQGIWHKLRYRHPPVALYQVAANK